MRGIIDRFEEKYAVIETNEGTINVLRTKLPIGACEGDVLIIENDIIEIDQEETLKRREMIKEKMKDLFK